MYVKRLSLRGFKSFARDTAFEFGPGVTAIVGPNGSGKSNVADAVRWVLGEQGLRLLRARKQEDVIFSGGGDRPPMGMAEVVLTLDNADGWLPLDFAEVEIGRRAYRDGDTEYLLNGSRIRLRDLTDLLQKANVGQNSYAVMGQGMVDEVLSLSPRDRRSLIDEAADVKRFRQKIADARTRLAGTRENMSRVELIVAELEPRLRRLRRQADRAGEHRELSARLARLLRDLYASRWDAARTAIARAGAELDQRIAEDEAADARAASLREQIDALGEEIARRREAVARREGDRDGAETRIRALDHGLDLDRERHAMTAARLEELRAEIEGLEAERAALGDGDDADGDDDGGGDGRAAAAGDEIAAARAALAHARDALTLAQREDAAVHRRAEELRGQIAALDDRIGDASRVPAEEDAGPGPEAVEARRRRLLVELVGYARRFAELRGREIAADASLTEARDSAAGARERLARVQAELREREAAGQEHVRALDGLRGRLEALRRVRDENEGVALGTRNVLIMGQVLIENVRPGSLGEAPELEGVAGLLSRHIRVPAGIEAAVNAALEHCLHAVVVEREEQAFRAIALLRERAAGRARFLPLDALRRVHPLNLQKERGVVGVASRLVRCDNRFRELVDALLGRVIVVEDLQAARRMLARGLGAVVTVDGTFLDPSGVVTGGLASAADNPFTFARQREMDEIPDRIAELEALVAEHEGQVAGAREAVERLLRAAADGDRAHAESRAELDAIRRDRDRERDRLHRLRRDLAAIHQRRRRLNGPADAPDADERRERLDRLTARRAEVGAELDALAGDLDAAPVRVEQAVAEVSGASARLAAAEGEARAAAHARELRRRSLERLDARLAQRRARLAEIETEAAAFAASVEDKTRELEELRAEHARASEDSAPDRDELHRLETHERSVQAAFGEAQAALLESRRRRLDLEAELGRARDRLESLRGEMAREGVELPAPSAAGEPEPPAVDAAALESDIAAVRLSIRKLGPINEEALEDFRENEERHEFLTGQLRDLTDAEARLQGAIAELNEEIRTRFNTAFTSVNAAFGAYFTAFFGGGRARLELLDPGDVIESGIEIEAQPPGKRLSSLSLLSGGERSLTAVALLFALLSVNPAPFCVLDEVDAALDEANVGRFVAELGRLAGRTQFLIVTHNRRTIEATDAIYGVSMGPGGVSATLSLRLSDLPGGGPPAQRPLAAAPEGPRAPAGAAGR